MTCILLLLLLTAQTPSQSKAQPCLNYEPDKVTITGTLGRKTFPGPPNYESVATGDVPEVAFLLRPTKPICVSGKGEYLQENDVSSIQLVVGQEDQFYETKWLINHEVILTGTLFHAHTGHHHTPVLLTVTSIRPALEEQLGKLSDAELIEQLANKDWRFSEIAARVIVARGERMIGPLMQVRGDRRLFWGALYRTNNFVFVPSGNAKKDATALRQGKLVSVEVAALFLISAIYHKTLSFSSKSYLTDLTLPEIDRDLKNTPPLIKRAWDSTEQWYGKVKEVGIEKLRASKEDPLKSGMVKFW